MFRWYKNLTQNKPIAIITFIFEIEKVCPQHELYSLTKA